MELLIAFIIAGAAIMYLVIRISARQTANRMWQEALKNPRKMRSIQRFIERGGPPPGV